MFVNIITAKQG